MRVSARNQLDGTVVDVTKGATTAHVTLEVQGVRIVGLRSPTRRSTTSDWPRGQRPRP